MTAPRLRTDFWVAALRRRAEAAGAFISIGRRGAEEAGAIFVTVDRLDGTIDLYAPAPQSAFGEDAPMDRLFSLVGQKMSEEAVQKRLDQELRFDPDLWVVGIEDREGRPFLDLVSETPERFTFR